MNLEIFAQKLMLYIISILAVKLHIIWQIFDNIYVFICSSWF